MANPAYTEKDGPRLIREIRAIADIVFMSDEDLVSAFYACGEQGRDEDAEPLRKEIMRRMESRIY